LGSTSVTTSDSSSGCKSGDNGSGGGGRESENGSGSDSGSGGPFPFLGVNSRPYRLRFQGEQQAAQWRRALDAATSLVRRRKWGRPKPNLYPTPYIHSLIPGTN
jgi:hypothetical protein